MLTSMPPPAVVVRSSVEAASPMPLHVLSTVPACIHQSMVNCDVPATVGIFAAVTLALPEK